MTDLFSSVELSPPVEVFALVAAYNDDNHEQKVNLGIGGSCPRAFSVPNRTGDGTVAGLSATVPSRLSQLE